MSDSRKSSYQERISSIVAEVRSEGNAFFECSVGDSAIVPTSGSVQPLKGGIYSSDADQMCRNMAADFEIDLAAWENQD